MNQHAQMNMGSMGGPVGTPGASGPSLTTTDFVKRLNTAIYDYLLRNELYDVARQFKDKMEIETDMKKSPNQREGQQSNGVDAAMDSDSKGIQDRPADLPAPLQFGDGPFLQDWWCQFWELFHSRGGKGRQATLAYIGTQRQAQKMRTNMMGGMDPASMQNLRGYTGLMQGVGNGMGMQADLKRAAMQNPRNLTQAQIQQMKSMHATQANALANQMERQGSQMDMGGPRSGSPGSGDAPSPKRPRLDGNMQAMNPGRPGPPGQMQGNQVGPLSSPVLPAETLELLRQNGIHPSQIPAQQRMKLALQPANHQLKSVEAYSHSLQQHMKATMETQVGPNMNKGMGPNAGIGPGGPQGSPMSQPGLDNGTGDFYNNTNGVRVAGAPPTQNNANGSHALQDYQMQLMLLEQQNKKRLLMARQEQDNIVTGAGGSVPNGQFIAPGMSPQGSRAGDPSPNPNDMQRGTPKVNKGGMSPNGEMAGRGSPQPGMIMDPNNIPPQMRGQLAMQNGAQMRPPSSHPMAGVPMTQEQMRAYQQQGGQMIPNGAWQPGQPPPGQMMPGQQPGQGGPLNMAARGANQTMAPPPPPQAGTQPSSPSQSQQAAPPTPNQNNKSKPSGKKDGNKKGAAANKKGSTAAANASTAANATPASESEQPPTPTPATPITPMAAQSFGGSNKAGQQVSNGATQQPSQGAQSGAVQPAQSQTAADMAANGAPFGSLDGPDQFSMPLDFDLAGGDVLDNFDFESFLNTSDGDMGTFDANFAFGDPALEAGGEMN